MLVLESTSNTTPSTEPEKWVDIATVAKHIGFCPRVTTQLMKSGTIPGRAVKNGKRTFYRFLLSEVDAAIKAL